MVNPVMKYMMKNKKDEDIFHSSTYGSAQNSGNVGTSSNVSFETRMRIDKNRKMVRRYDDSRVVNDALGNNPKPQAYSKGSDGFLNKNNTLGANNSVKK